MLGASILATLMSSVAPIFLLQGMDIPQERIARGAVHALVLGARSNMDLQYDGIVYDERSMAISLRGVTAKPPAAADLTDCVVEAEALSLTPAIATDAIGIRIEVDDLSASPGCAPGASIMATAIFGPDALTAERASIDLDYEMGRSALMMTAYIQTAKTGTVDMAMTASGLHYSTQPIERDEDETAGGFGPAKETVIGGTLDAFEMTVDDIDGLRGLLPMLGIAGDPADEAVSMLRDGLGEVADTASGGALLDSAEVEIGRFLEDGGALTVRMTADEPVPLSAMTETTGPEEMVRLLQPVIAARPQAGEMLFVWESPDAMAEQVAALSGEDKRALASALATGQGVPRSRDMAMALYIDLASEGDAEAALSASMLLIDEDPVRAYALALDAGAADAQGARLVLDRIEAGLSLETVLRIQGKGDAPDAEPVADIGVLRSRARGAVDGQGARRSYTDALFHASLAAAAGDRVSATLYERLVARFEGEEEWSEIVREASGRSMTAWTSGGVGATFAERP